MIDYQMQSIDMCVTRLECYLLITTNNKNTNKKKISEHATLHIYNYRYD